MGPLTKKVNNDTSHVNPDKWREHFSSLLGPKVELNQSDQDLISFVEQNCNKFESELSDPFTRKEFFESVSSLSNNKAVSFDQISNEILKTAKHSIVNPTLRLFNALLSHSKYPTQRKNDILTPIHK